MPLAACFCRVSTPRDPESHRRPQKAGIRKPAEEVKAAEAPEAVEAAKKPGVPKPAGAAKAAKTSKSVEAPQKKAEVPNSGAGQALGLAKAWGASPQQRPTTSRFKKPQVRPRPLSRATRARG